MPMPVLGTGHHCGLCWTRARLTALPSHFLLGAALPSHAQTTAMVAARRDDALRARAGGSSPAHRRGVSRPAKVQIKHENLTVHSE